jgi:hypothetical protein
MRVSRPDETSRVPIMDAHAHTLLYNVVAKYLKIVHRVLFYYLR